jgi:hypothetical protein
MNKQQILAKMSPEQLKKMNIPVKPEATRITGPLSNLKAEQTGPNKITYIGPLEELLELQTRMDEDVAQPIAGFLVPTDDGYELPTYSTSTTESAKLGFIDFHQTPPEWVTTKVGDISVTYLDADPIMFTSEPVTSGFVQVVDEDYVQPEVTYSSSSLVWEDKQQRLMPSTVTPISESIKLGPGMREQLKDDTLIQHHSPLSAAKLVAALSEPKSKKKKRRR